MTVEGCAAAVCWRAEGVLDVGVGLDARGGCCEYGGEVAACDMLRGRR